MTELQDWITSALDFLPEVQIVFAEENPDTISEIQVVMDQLRWKGHYVHNAKELIDRTSDLITQGDPIDAIVADIHYFTGPKLTGITAARVIRKVMPTVPFIFISSHVGSIIREEVRRVDAELLIKPINVGQLFERLTQLIFWYRIAGPKDFKGHDRRVTSINVTGYARRATDQVLAPPPRILAALQANEERK